MNIQQFQYVLAVVDLKNFEAAAERCFVSQSTLSTMIGRFESEIGIRIFNRQTKPVSITSEGEQIIEQLRILSHEVDALKDLIQELKGEMSGFLRVGIIPTIAPYLLPLFLIEFAERFPEVDISVSEMTTEEIRRALKLRSLDVGILALPIYDPDLKEVELYSEPFLLYDCSGKVRKSKVEVQDLDYSKLCLLKEGHCLRTQVNRLCELSDKFAGKEVNYKFESGSMDSLLRITALRKGITVLPFLATSALPEEEKNKLSEFALPVPVRTVGLITHKFFVKKRLLRGLKEVLLQSTENLLPKPTKRRVFDPI